MVGAQANCVNKRTGQLWKNCPCIWPTAAHWCKYSIEEGLFNLKQWKVKRESCPFSGVVTLVPDVASTETFRGGLVPADICITGWALTKADTQQMPPFNMFCLPFLNLSFVVTDMSGLGLSLGWRHKIRCLEVNVCMWTWCLNHCCSQHPQGSLDRSTWWELNLSTDSLCSSV